MWLGIDVAERTTTAQVVFKGKPAPWPLIGLLFAKRSEAQHGNSKPETGPASAGRTYIRDLEAVWPMSIWT
ncbi:MAG: hypothetical protein KGJ09_07950 [Candidatus Omnitrophica bacterium]|nr:hypothetical protein [Candidatus Omnitrophota bacterium]